MTDPYAAFSSPVGGSAPRPAPARPAARPAMRPTFADDRDAIIRTVLGEAGGEDDTGQLAVASVINNRTRSRGLTPSQVVLEQGQFEPWGNAATAQRLLAIRPDSPEYVRAAGLVDRALAGEDPTGGASHFYSPTAQAALGRQAPDWDDGSGQDIGRHRFFRHEGGQPQAQSADPYADFSAPQRRPERSQEELAREYAQRRYDERGGGDPVYAARRAAERPWELRGPEFFRDPAYSGSSTQEGDVIVDMGVVDMGDGTYRIPGDDGYTVYRVTAAELAQWQGLAARDREDDRKTREALAARRSNPEYQRAFADAQLRADSTPDLLKAITAGPTLEGSREIDAFGAGLETRVGNLFKRLTGQEVPYGADMASQAVRDVERDRSQMFMQEHPEQAIGGRLFGGLFTPGLKSTGGFIARGQGADRLGRAGLVGAGYGSAAGFLGAEGDPSERLDDAAVGGLAGYGTGLLGQAIGDRLMASVARRQTAPSEARLLSQRGVDLTPGQMMGGAARRIEEGMESLPVLGDSIKSARNRNMGTFDRAVINEALEPIGRSIQTPGGREAVGEAADIIGREYDRILDPLTFTPDAQFRTDWRAVMAPRNLSRTSRARLSDALSDIDARLQNPVPGRDFKQIESELTALIRSAEKGGPDGTAIVRPLRDARQALRDALRRQDAQAADDLLAVNTANANFERIRKAAANPTTARNDGMIGPGPLNSVLARAEGRNYARGEALLQDTAQAGINVLGSTVPDSGTPFRSLLAMGVPAAGGLTMLGQGGAATIGAVTVGLGSLGYGKLAQDLLNAAYRNTSPGAVQKVLGALGRAAQRDPALQPYYADAVRLLLPEQERPQGLLSGGQSDAQPPTQETPRPQLLQP